MPHLGVGILDAQSNPPAPIPFTYDTDWTTGSLPSPWVESGSGYTYTGTGTYGGAADGAHIGIWTIDTTDTTYAQLTFMVGILVNTWSETDFSVGINGVPGSNWSAQYFPTGSTSDSIDISIGNEFAAGSTTGTMGTGILVFGATMDTSGNWTWYYMKSGSDTVTTSTNSPVSITIETITVYLDAYDFVNAVSGTPGDVRLVGTYVDSSAVLDQTAIEAQAVTWGWTP